MARSSKRKTISREVETEVLVLSRRRCCICFAINRDFSEKKGQIAHLDKERANPNLENLAYLCLDHHDSYDSKTSQSKNYTINEIKHFREILYKAVAKRIDLELGVIGEYEHTENTSQIIPLHRNSFAVIFSTPMRCTPTLRFLDLPKNIIPKIENWTNVGFIVQFPSDLPEIENLRFHADAAPQKLEKMHSKRLFVPR